MFEPDFRNIVAAANTWYHLVAVAESGGLMRLYVNGAEEGTALSIDTPWTNGTQWMMGRETAGGYSYYEGLLDDVRVYQTPKSPEDTLPLCSEDMASDFDNNCIVDMHDLLIVLQSWLSEWGAERVESIEKAYE